jgi:ATP/ADP translocase
MAVSVGGGVLVGISVMVAGISVGGEVGTSVGWLPQAEMRPAMSMITIKFAFMNSIS